MDSEQAEAVAPAGQAGARTLTWDEVAVAAGLAVSRGDAAAAITAAGVGRYATPGTWQLYAGGASARVRVFEAADGLRFDVLDDVDEGA